MNPSPEKGWQETQRKTICSWTEKFVVSIEVFRAIDKRVTIWFGSYS
jgi:hypothetical protein